MNRTVRVLIWVALIAAMVVFACSAQTLDYCNGESFFAMSCQPTTYQPMTMLPAGTDLTPCSAHTLSVVGDDHFIYNIIDQCYGAGCYARSWKRPPDTAPAAQEFWDRCFVLHQFTGGGFPCDRIHPPAGVLIYNPIFLSEVTPASLRESYEESFHCDVPTPVPTIGGVTSTPTTSPSRTPTVRPPTATITSTRVPSITASATAVPPTNTPSQSPTRVKTPHIGPAPSKTNTPNIGPAPTPRSTHIGPSLVATPNNGGSPKATSTRTGSTVMWAVFVAVAGAVVYLTRKFLTSRND